MYEILMYTPERIHKKADIIERGNNIKLVVFVREKD